MTLTIETIADRFEEAAQTLRRLPNPPGSGPRGYKSLWPEIVREPEESYGYEAARMRVIPSPEAIGRMEEVLQEWLRHIPDPADRRIVWMRAERYRWREICIAVGCARATADRRHRAALELVRRGLSRGRIRTNREGGSRRGSGQTGKGGAAPASPANREGPSTLNAEGGSRAPQP